MIIGPEIKIIEAHSLLGPVRPTGPLIATVASAEADFLSFDLAMMRRRGRFEPSLAAVNHLASSAWLERYVIEGLPSLPPLPQQWADEMAFLRWLARENGHDESGIFERSGLKRVDFNRFGKTWRQQDVLLHLPPWTPHGEFGSEVAKVYWQDTGVLHQLYRWNDAELAPGYVWPGHKRHERNARLRERVWESFVVSSLVRAAGVRAKPTVWQGSTGEIDLILEWSFPRETWAIEITMGRQKQFKAGHALGFEITEADRSILVYDDEVTLPKLSGQSKMPRLIQCMNLREALVEVLLGP